LYTRLSRGASSFRLLYAAEVKCVTKDDNPLEMRVHRGDITSPMLEWNGKFLKWYLQSRFSGADNIIVGERDHARMADGQENRLCRLSQIPTGVISKLGGRHWNADCCFAFLHTLMVEIQRLLPSENRNCMLTINYGPRWPSVRLYLEEGYRSSDILTSTFMEKFNLT